MDKKILIFKNDRLGDLMHSIEGINAISVSNPDKKVIIYLSKISEKFFFLLKKKNTEVKILNYDLKIIEKIKIFFYLRITNVDSVYILSPKFFYFFLPCFFRKIKFFAICVNSTNRNRRPSLFLRRFLYKYIINDRETLKKRPSISSLIFELCNSNNSNSLNTIEKEYDHVPISETLKKYLPKQDYALIHFKSRSFKKLNWGLDSLDTLISEINKYYANIVLIKDIEIDENNLILRNKFNTVDFKSGKNYRSKNEILFFDNVVGDDLFNLVKFSSKVVAMHGTMTAIASFLNRPCLDLFECEIRNYQDYHSYKNAFHEFMPKYPKYDFIIPCNDIHKTIRKMKFSLQKK